MLRFVLFLQVYVTCFCAEPTPYPLFRSEDRGRTWTRSDSGLPGDARINGLAQNDKAIVAGTDAGIFVSDVEGKSWRKASVPGTNMSAVAVAEVNGAFFAAAGKALFLSTNGGSSWTRNHSFPPRVARALFSHGGDIYVGTDADGVYRSADLGRTWKHLADGLPPNSQVLAYTSVGDNIFAGLYSKGLYRLDAEGRWIRVGASAEIRPLALAAVGGTLIAGHNPGGIFVSHDIGGTWHRWNDANGPSDASFGHFEFPFRQSAVSLDAPVWDLAAGDGLAFAGVADGIFLSENPGRTWSRATRGLPAVSPGVAFLVRSNLVLAATITNHKSRSIGSR